LKVELFGKKGDALSEVCCLYKSKLRAGKLQPKTVFISRLSFTTKTKPGKHHQATRTPSRCQPYNDVPQPLQLTAHE
jgi:hypothetical protein